MSDTLKASDGSLYIQLKPGGAPEYLGCVDLSAIAEPAGAETLIYCRDLNGDFTAVGSSTAVPGAVTTNLKALLFPEASILDQIRLCPIQIYALQKSGGKRGVFSNWVRGAVLHHARVATRTLENLVMREADDPATFTLDINAWNPVYHVRAVKVSRPSIAETTALNALAVCVGGANCDSGALPWQTMFAGGVAPAGSPTERADIWQTEDAGGTWLNLTGGAAHPFVSGEDIKAAACVQLDKTTFRWFAVREAVSGEPLKVAYSDDSGANWVLVSVGSTNNEGCANAKAFYAPDRQHLWVATTAGNVYFSDDAGLTWTLQGSATASGGNGLNAVHFADADNGYAAGNSGTLIVTNDGGDSWDVVTPPDPSQNITALWVFTATRVLIGDNADGLYQSWDGGANWESKAFSGQAGTGTVKALSFANDLCGFMAHNTVGNVGSLLRTIDGGHTWDKLSTPTNTGLNDLVAGDENTAFAVGNAQGGTSVIFKISG